MNIKCVGLIFSGLLLAAPMVHAADTTTNSTMDATADKSMHHRGDGKHKEWAKDMDLTADQKKQLEDIKKSNRGDMRKLMDQIQDKHKELNAELSKSTLDDAKIGQIQNEIKTLSGQLVDQRVSHLIAIRKILTPEQYKKFSDRMDEYKDDFKQKFEERRSKHKKE